MEITGRAAGTRHRLADVLGAADVLVDFTQPDQAVAKAWRRPPTPA